MGLTAFITGITGQDGSYLAELLLFKGYEVHGLVRRSSTFNRPRIEHLRPNPKLHLHYGDITDSSSLIQTIGHIQPDEIYHLAGQSHVKISFEIPEYTAEVDANGTLKILETVRALGLSDKIKIYNACTSELYGLSQPPQDETTPFQPCSPYAIAKLYSYWIARNYREAYGMKVWNGILFNHESPRRGLNFVTRKITVGVARIVQGQQDTLILGNLNAKRDWGYAPDYVEAMYLMLQTQSPQDYVIATGAAYTVRDFTTIAFKIANIDITWVGTGLDEHGVDSRGKTLVSVSKAYFRPMETEYLLGNFSKAKRILHWQPNTYFYELVNILVKADMELVAQGREING